MEIDSKSEKENNDSSLASFRATKFNALEHTLYDVIVDSRLDQLSMEERLCIFNSWKEDMDRQGLSYYNRYSAKGCKTQRIVYNPFIGKGYNMVNFASNDYLNMSQHPLVIEAGIEALRNYGAGSGAACNASGNTLVKLELEREIANTFKAEKALVFNSGYTTNVGVLNALLRSNDVAIVDLLAHSSIMDGVQNKNKMFFKHNDMVSLESVLKRANKQYANKIVVVDGVYSMDGNIANIPEISSLCKKYKALLFVDEAHAFGVIGKNGLGVLDHFDLPPTTIDILIGTLSKAVGSSGGFVAANEKIINYLELASRTYLCTTGAFIASYAVALASIKIIKQDAQRRTKLWENINYFRAKLNHTGLNTGNSETAIFPIILADHNKVLEITKMMGNQGIQVSGIPYPLVPRKHTRVRMTVTAAMSTNQMNKGHDELLSAIRNYEQNHLCPNLLEEQLNSYQQQKQPIKRRQSIQKSKASKELTIPDTRRLLLTH